jgi:predicted nuclease of predicted toxin-antitoxin system
MKILFDQGVPVPLRREMKNHIVDTLFERGWSDLENGQLFDAAEANGYEVFVTTDQNIKHQQNLTGRRIAVVVLMSTAWPRIRSRVSEIVKAVDAAIPGTLVEVPI